MKITIITVVFNAVNLIESTILSVIDQHNNNIEYIIIDGGSTDGTLDVVRKYDKAITYWISEPDKGIYDAMNKGWAASPDDSSILYLGAGDKLLQLPTYIDNNKVVYGNVRIGDSEKYYPSTHGWRLKLGNTLHHQALLVPKKIHPLPPFDLTYKIYADFDFNQRLYKLGSQFIFDNSLIAYAAPDGVSANLNLREMVKVVMKNFGIFYALACMAYSMFYIFRVRCKKAG